MFIRSLENEYEPVPKPAGDIIIILGGGATLDTPNAEGTGHLSGSASGRVLTGFLLQRKLAVPVIVAGGQVYDDSGNEAQITKQLLLAMGVADDKIFLEDKSINTGENAKNIKKILTANGFKNPILVTSAFHMKRAVVHFEKIGVNVLPYPADYKVNVVNKVNIHHFMPSSGALEYSSMALKEYLGLAAARWLNY